MKKFLSVVLALIMICGIQGDCTEIKAYGLELESPLEVHDPHLYMKRARLMTGNGMLGLGPYILGVFGQALELFDLAEIYDSSVTGVDEKEYTEEDLYLLSKIVTVESGDTSMEMALAIANTVLNRVKSPDFPDTIEEVIFQVEIHVQFPPAHRESFASLEPMPVSIAAAREALEGNNNIGDALYFNNQPFSSKTDDLIEVIDGEYFYR